MNKLPSELLVGVMQEMDDFDTINNMRLVCKGFKNTYDGAKRAIQSSVLANALGPDVRPAALIAYRSSQCFPRVLPPEPQVNLADTNVLQAFLARREYMQHQTLPATEPQLSELIRQHLRVKWFADFIYQSVAPTAMISESSACPLTTQSDTALHMTPDEKVRLYRALYLFETFCNVSATFSTARLYTRCETDLSTLRDRMLVPTHFFSYYPSWEIHELRCIVSFLSSQLRFLDEVLTHDVRSESLLFPHYHQGLTFVHEILDEGLGYVKRLLTADGYAAWLRILKQPRRSVRHGTTDFLDDDPNLVRTMRFCLDTFGNQSQSTSAIHTPTAGLKWWEDAEVVDTDVETFWSRQCLFLWDEERLRRWGLLDHSFHTLDVPEWHALHEYHQEEGAKDSATVKRLHERILKLGGSGYLTRDLKHITWSKEISEGKLNTVRRRVQASPGDALDRKDMCMMMFHGINRALTARPIRPSGLIQCACNGPTPRQSRASGYLMDVYGENVGAILSERLKRLMVKVYMEEEEKEDEEGEADDEEYGGDEDEEDWEDEEIYKNY